MCRHAMNRQSVATPSRSAAAASGRTAREVVNRGAFLKKKSSRRESSKTLAFLNHMQPNNTLPSELLVHIFDLLLLSPDALADDRIERLYLCSRWYQILVSNPRFPTHPLIQSG